jgi:hypothetical protein
VLSLPGAVTVRDGRPSRPPSMPRSSEDRSVPAPDEESRAWVAKDGRPLSRRPKPFEPPATPAGKVNVTDPDSRNIKAPRGYVQGYNAQAVTNDRQVVIAAEVTADSPDLGHLEPMVTAAQSELEAAGITATPTRRPVRTDLRARRRAGHGRPQSQTNAGARRLSGRTPRARPERERGRLRERARIASEGRALGGAR